MHRRNGYFTGQWLIISPISAGEWTDRLSNGQFVSSPQSETAQKENFLAQ